MQTFLPYPSFADSAAVLDGKRLGKQRVEAIQVLRGLIRPGYGWRHHPAVRMWTGYQEALVCYGLQVCATWRAGGHADTCAATLLADLGAARVRSQGELDQAGELPPWIGDEEFHRTHQSSLVRKLPEHYRRFFPDVPDDLPYCWPVSDRVG